MVQQTLLRWRNNAPMCYVITGLNIGLSTFGAKPLYQTTVNPLPIGPEGIKHKHLFEFHRVENRDENYFQTANESS